LKKADVLKRLDVLKDMSDNEITLNAKWIRELATAAYSLIKQK
jgi:hypothetical protein